MNYPFKLWHYVYCRPLVAPIASLGQPDDPTSQSWPSIACDQASLVSTTAQVVLGEVVSSNRLCGWDGSIELACVAPLLEKARQKVFTGKINHLKTQNKMFLTDHYTFSIT